MKSEAIEQHTATFRTRSRLSDQQQASYGASGSVRAEQIRVPVVGEVSRTQAAVGGGIALVLLLFVVMGGGGGDEGERIVFR